MHRLGARLRRRDLERFRRLGIDPQASAAHSWHFPGLKLRLGGDALGADPTYLLYLAYRSRGELRRIDFAAWPRTRTSRLTLPPESTLEGVQTSERHNNSERRTARREHGPTRLCYPYEYPFGRLQDRTGSWAT